MTLSGWLDAILFAPFHRARRRAAARHAVPVKELSSQGRAETFQTIYRNGEWGRDPDGAAGPWSGTGSHSASIVEPYLAAVIPYLRQLDPKPRVVDLGCGDFNIGAQLAPHAETYLACDLVAEVIAANRVRATAPNVEFRVLDIVDAPLPAGDVVILRQVLQHLSNSEVAAVAQKLPGACRHLIQTEHLAAPRTFVPNLDKPTGCRARIGIGSGIDLAAPPFNLPYKTQRVLCDTTSGNGIIRTVAFTFRDCPATGVGKNAVALRAARTTS